MYGLYFRKKGMKRWYRAKKGGRYLTKEAAIKDGHVFKRIVGTGYEVKVKKIKRGW